MIVVVKTTKPGAGPDTEQLRSIPPCPPDCRYPVPACERNGCLLLGDTRFPLADGENLIGRSEEASVRLTAASVSRRHAIIVSERNRTKIIDLGSRNGTFVGEKRIDDTTEIIDGAKIRIGTIWLVFRAGG